MTKRPVILCVDDEWNGLEGRRILFEGRGYNVLVAASGEEALQLFASHPTDLVLLDYHMPKANGDVIAERMKASQPDVPIAMLSADEGLPESALESVDVFISKSSMTVVNGINDKGVLVGFYVDAKSHTDGLVATPAAEEQEGEIGQ